VGQAVGFLLPFLLFLAFYAFLLRRARRQGRHADVQWGWLAAVAACAGVAILLSYVL